MQEAVQPDLAQVIIRSLAFMGGVGAFFGAGLAWAAKKFAVKTDPLVEAVREALPGANCGACGFAGCQGYAEAVVKDAGLSPGLCAPGKADVAALVAKITGKEAAEVIPMVAKVFCRGDECKAGRRFKYDGVKDCRAAVLVAGGDKTCQYGCLGYGTCAGACPFGAIKMSPEHLPVIDREKCTACGVCVAACPKSIIHLTPAAQKVHIRCSSLDKGPVVKKACEIGCIACGLCAKGCPEGAITVEDNLARIDYEKCTHCETCVLLCPQHTIEDLLDPAKEQAPRIKLPKKEAPAEAKQEA
ncbi:MAG TPA: Fe-S cluster domain-containing protein [Nitrospirota bacterium]|nr:Fe-S cluster domain-containing protein [Nitrospirota bacterium]